MSTLRLVSLTGSFNRPSRDVGPSLLACMQVRAAWLVHRSWFVASLGGSATWMKCLISPTQRTPKIGLFSGGVGHARQLTLAATINEC